MIEVAYLIKFVNTSEVHMKSVAIGTVGLVLSLGGSLLASAPNPQSNSAIQSTPTVSLSPSNPLTDGTPNSFGSRDSFLVVDKNEQDMMDFPMNDRGVNPYAYHKSVESSGNPADSSGVPTPRAGWISFFGLLFVIAGRRLSRSRRRVARPAIG